MKFNYQARTQKGQVQTGTVEASSRETAIILLQKQRLYVTVLEEATRSPIYARRIKLFEKISRKDIVLFSRLLSILFKAKIPLVESLQTLSIQTTNFDFKEKILKISEDVQGGASFSDALSVYPGLFSSFYISMLKAGEASGKLSESLEYLAEHLEREYHIASRVKGALIYPTLIVFFILIVISLMIFFVFPKFAEILEITDQKLPTITLMMMDLGGFLRRWSWIFIVTMPLFIIFIWRYYYTQEGKKFFDKFFLKLPIFGSFLKIMYISRFAENLSTLISGGLPIAQSLEITGDIVGNTVYKEIISKAKDEVRRGEPISSVLSRSPELFPPLICQMTLVGEETGTLDKTLINVVDFYQKETDRAIESLLSILEPALIMFLGLIVGGMMMSILMPLYQTMSF